MLQRLLVTGLLFLCLYCPPVRAQQAAAPADTVQTSAAPAPAVSRPVFTCAADAYYRYDMGQTASNNRTSFTNSHNSFELGMISVKAEHSVGKVGMVADIGLGKRAEEFSYTDDRTRFIIKQLNLSYAFKNGLKFTAGSWATHVGYELVDAYANRNYSMSYLFSYGPFFHTGLKAEKSFGRTGLMLGISNPTDLKSTTLNSKYFIGQLSTATKNEQLKIWLNYQGGKPNDSTRVQQLDLVSTLALGSKYSVGLNGSYASYKLGFPETSTEEMRDWWGLALYLNADPAGWLGITLRSEFFNDAGHLNVFSAMPEGGNVWENTLSFQLKKDNLILMPEFRVEKASELIFTDADGQASDVSAGFLMAAIYKF